MASTIGKCKLFRIKYTTLLEGETFLRNKHEIVFFEIKCTFFGRKENTIGSNMTPKEHFGIHLKEWLRNRLGSNKSQLKNLLMSA